MDSLETRVAVIEQKLEDIPPREWVKDFVRPLQESIGKIENSVTSLASRAEALFKAHDELLREKAAQDRKTMEERTTVGMIKKWGPILSIVASLFIVYNVLSSLAQVWLKGHGF